VPFCILIDRATIVALKQHEKKIGNYFINYGGRTMDMIMVLLASFGGGVFGSLIGGLAAFIFTGIAGLIGIAIILSGGSDVFLNEVAFGPYFGPHIAFAGAVAATAYAGRKTATKNNRLKEQKNLSGADVVLEDHESINGETDVENGADITSPMFKTIDPIVLLIGGVFGMLGYGINYLLATVMELPMDTIAFTVFILGLVARFVFGKSGLTGVFPENEAKFNFTGVGILFNTIWGAALGALIGYFVLLTEVPTIGFVVSTTTLIFIYFGLTFPVSHHVSMVAGIAAITFGNIWMAILFGILAVITGDFVQRYTNTYVDTHLDMPATVIALWTFVILGFFG